MFERLVSSHRANGEHSRGSQDCSDEELYPSYHLYPRGFNYLEAAHEYHLPILDNFDVIAWRLFIAPEPSSSRSVASRVHRGRRHRDHHRTVELLWRDALQGGPLVRSTSSGSHRSDSQAKKQNSRDGLRTIGTDT